MSFSFSTPFAVIYDGPSSIAGFAVSLAFLAASAFAIAKVVASHWMTANAERFRLGQERTRTFSVLPEGHQFDVIRIAAGSISAGVIALQIIWNRTVEQFVDMAMQINPAVLIKPVLDVDSGVALLGQLACVPPAVTHGFNNDFIHDSRRERRNNGP